MSLNRKLLDHQFYCSLQFGGEECDCPGVWAQEFNGEDGQWVTHTKE